MSQEINKSGSCFKQIKEPTESMTEHYAKMFRRNQMKFIRRSNLEVDHLGSEFIYEGINMEIIGSSDSINMVVKDVDNNRYYLIHSDIVTNSVLINK